MGSKAWSLRYLVQKLQLGMEEMIGQFPNSSSATVALSKGIEAYSKVVLL